MIRKQNMIGWQEWLVLPDLGLPAIKAKVDTGARTSSLHAYDIVPFKQDGQNYVRFKVHPLQGNNKLEISCSAPLVDKRNVISSNGEREKRYVIKTPIEIGSKIVDAEITLTSRHKMSFRMLLGRAAMRTARLGVSPAKSFLLGKKTDVKELYKNLNP